LRVRFPKNLRLRLTPEDEKHLSKRSTHNREAYQLLLKSQYHMNKWTPEALGPRRQLFLQGIMKSLPVIRE
jgi:hypothetical protein